MAARPTFDERARAVAGVFGRADFEAPGESLVGRAWLGDPEDDPLGVLARLFLVGAPVDASAFERAVEPTTTSDWLELGFIEVRDGSVWPLQRVRRHDRFLFAYDFVRDHIPRNFVMPVSRSSVSLARVTPREQVESVLDLGTGCGYHALLASVHSERIVGTDVNERALELARFNAVLNDVDGVTFRNGNLFEPVAGETFDLIVSNPPFVISPSEDFTFRDGGRVDDGLTEAVVAGAGRHLVEGGVCQILCNWAQIESEDWRERVAGWVAGTGCDLFVVSDEAVDPGIYAMNWLRDSNTARADSFVHEFDRWTRYYRERGIEAIHAGAMTIRRRSAAENWVAIREEPDALERLDGAAIARIFRSRDAVERLSSEEDVTAARPLLAPGVRLHQVMEAGDGGWKQASLELRTDERFPQRGDIDALMASFVARCDGIATVGELTRHIAEVAGLSVEEAKAPVRELVRDLVAGGFLTV